MSIISSIKRSYKSAKRKKWDTVYWAFDIHETIIVPNYQYGNIPTEFYPHARETMQMISKRKDIIPIIFTCSHPEEIKKYLAFFKKNKIDFKYVNENPDVPNGSYGCYDNKFYFNVLFEDKGGFDAKTDWLKVKKFLQTNKKPHGK
jgi:hypothetical protein